jgi:hypothetical protein
MRENDLTLETVEDLQALRTAAASPQAWALVSPQVKSALTLPLAKMMSLGGTMDDLLAAIEDSLQTLAHPVNQNLARTMTALQHVNLSLDYSLGRRDDEQRRVGRGRMAQQRDWSTKGAEARRINDPAFERAVRDYARRHPDHSPRAIARSLHAKYGDGVTLDGMRKRVENVLKKKK